jgi:hypothetical protein
MDLQLRSLLWKEWRERRTQFFVSTFAMIAATVACLANEWAHRSLEPVDSFYGTALLFGWLMPVFVAMRTSLGETTDRTRSFTSALPISPRRRGWIRLAAGAGVLVVPIVLSAVLLSLYLAAGWVEQLAPAGTGSISPADRPAHDVASALRLVACVTVVAACATTALYILLSLIGTELPTEALLGFVAVVVVLLSILTLFLGYNVVRSPVPELSLLVVAIVPWAAILPPTGLVVVSHLLPVSLLLNLIGQFALAAWFVRRYGRMLPGGSERSRETPPKVRCRWSLPLPTRSIALTWLTLRESVPMCGVGLLIACLMTLFQMGTCTESGPARYEPVLRKFADAMPSSMFAVALLWAAVVGAGSFAAETDARLGEFWRTWPVPFWRFFAIKFTVGLLAVLLVLDGTTIAAGWGSPNWGDYFSMNWPYVACIMPLHATIFAVAVAWTCLLRRPVLGGMATVITYLVLTNALCWSPMSRRFDPIVVFDNLARGRPHRPVDFMAHEYPVVIAAMGVILIASVVTAALALRRYDPKRQTD